MTTAKEILTCDMCRQAIDELGYGMVFWNGGADYVVTSFALAHKDCRAQHDDDWSAELTWFADAPVALRRLAGMADDYVWTGEQLKRLLLIGWAVSAVANTDQKADAVQFEEMMG